MDAVPDIHGRGTPENPANRFERIEVEYDPNEFDPDAPAPKTEFFLDDSKSIISWNDAPDLHFNASINPYRGCEHGCAYCYARPFHEYLGYSAGLDFETKIHVKRNAPALLRREFMKKSWRPQVVMLSGATDPYQPVERKLEITRGLLQVCAEFRNPVNIVTKNALVTRDLDLLAQLAKHGAASVAISITTLDEGLCRKLEPRTSSARKRFQALAQLNSAGVPAGVMVAPVIPGLTDQDLPGILSRAGKAGAAFAVCIPVRLPAPVDGMFEAWLDHHFPGRKNGVLKRIRELRGGQLNDRRAGRRMRGEGILAEHLNQLFHLAREKAGIPSSNPGLSTEAFRRPGATRQMFN